MNIYNVGPNNASGNPTVGSLLTTDTISAFVPWRPPADRPDGRWTDPDGNPHNGLYFTVNFNLASSGVTLPDDVIVAVALNTADYGSTPTHDENAPYNVLNFGLNTSNASVGQNGDAFQSQPVSAGGTGSSWGACAGLRSVSSPPRLARAAQPKTFPALPRK